MVFGLRFWYDYLLFWDLLPSAAVPAVRASPSTSVRTLAQFSLRSPFAHNLIMGCCDEQDLDATRSEAVDWDRLGVEVFVEWPLFGDHWKVGTLGR